MYIYIQIHTVTDHLYFQYLFIFNRSNFNIHCSTGYTKFPEIRFAPNPRAFNAVRMSNGCRALQPVPSAEQLLSNVWVVGCLLLFVCLFKHRLLPWGERVTLSRNTMQIKSRILFSFFVVDLQLKSSMMKKRQINIMKCKLKVHIYSI